VDARPGRCWYCGEAKLVDDDPPEHVVPAVLGGELTTDRVCRECNTKAGRYIDKPLLDDWLVGWERVLWDIRDNRRRQDRPPPMPKEELTLPSGARAKLRHDGTFEVIPDVKTDGDKLSIVAGSDAEAEGMIRKVEERAKRQGKTLTLDDMRRELSKEVAGRVQLSGLVWLRATTKMAVAAASLVLDESWLDMPQAAKYREFLWADAPTTFDGKDPATAFPSEQHPLIGEIVRPPNHLVLMVPSAERTVVVTELFGNLSAGSVAFDVHGVAPQNAWVLDPVARTVEETTFEKLVEKAALRIVDSRSGA
jgi:HNH endonuclease